MLVIILATHSAPAWCGRSTPSSSWPGGAEPSPSPSPPPHVLTTDFKNSPGAENKHNESKNFNFDLLPLQSVKLKPLHYVLQSHEGAALHSSAPACQD